MMAGKAVLIKDILFNSLKDDKDLATALNEQFQAFRVENQRSRLRCSRCITISSASIRPFA